MSSTLIETISSASSPEVQPGPLRNPWRARLKWLAVAAACLWLADAGLSILIQHSALKRRLTARLEAAFGRPVEVGSYRFTLWTGPALEAHSVTVGEDPRFGNEYFLRAESMKLRIGWRSLFSGRLELDTISLDRPSLNLVRSPTGDWNLAEWLPRPSSISNPPPTAPAARPANTAVRFRRIDVDNGRINFKRDFDKLPFAFTNVRGSLETEGGGLWRLDLTAVPSRAAVIVQQPGVLHLAGHVGGTSSRLRPAALALSWSNASLTDVSRLVRDRDYGVRGEFDTFLAAHTMGDSWLLSGRATLMQLHRWDLALRSDNLSLNVIAAARLDETGSRLELTHARIEAPHSNARITGALDWTVPGPDSPATQLNIVSDSLALSDLLAWARAFHANIGEGVALNGFAKIQVNLGGWPPKIQSGGLDLPRAVMSGPQLRVPVRVGSVLAQYDAKKGITLSPTTVTLGAAANSFRIDGSTKADASSLSLHVQGSTAQVRDLLAASNQLGWDLARGWDVAGPVRCDLRWQGVGWPPHTTLTGMVEWGTEATGASLRAQFLNLPVEQVHAHVDLKPGLTHLALSSAQAFGARWSGTLDHDLSDGWRFAVSGDTLSADDLDRWLNPRWRESLLGRVFPFFSSRPAAGDATAGILARGRLALDEFTLTPVVVHRLRGDLVLDSRHLEFANVEGQFYRGQLKGSLRADLEASPDYEAVLDLSSVDLRALSSEFPSLADIFAGSASAKAVFRARGPNRAALLDGLECRGTARVSALSAKGFAFPETAESDPPQPDATLSRDASATFACGDGKIEFQDLLLRASDSSWDGAGFVDYGQKVDLQFQPLDSSSPEPRPAKLTAAPDEYRITGTIDAPIVARVVAPARSADEKP